ncbi:MAG: DUF3138 family protein [Burkholderiales bacterium]
MNLWKPAALALALAAAYPGASFAQSNDELLKELKALKDRVGELEKKLGEKPADGDKQWGMTPAQQQDLSRVGVKTEGLEDAIESQGLKGLKISGFFDPAYIFNQRQHRAGFQFLNRVSDDGYNYDNSYFGTAAIDFQKEMEGGTKWRLTLMPNRGAGSIADSSGNSIVHEASVSVPLGDLQTRLIAGQIPDWSGYEYTQPTTTKLVTRGLLLDFTEPTAYTGAGMEIIRGKWDVKAVLANYNTTKQPADRKAPVIAYRVDYSKGEFNGFGFAGVHGKAANFSAAAAAADPSGSAPDSRLDLFEFDAYFTRGDLTLQGQVGFGRQKNASIVPASDGTLRDSQWWGVSALAAYKFIPRWEAVARFDYIDNHKNGGGLLQYSSEDGRNGIGPDGNLGCTTTGWVDGCDKGANRYALALGVNYLLTPNTTLKAEYRMDRANLPVFLDTKDGSFRKSNSLLGASVVVSF